MSVSRVVLDTTLTDWLGQNAQSLDADGVLAAELLPRLAAGGLLGVGVPEALGGSGGALMDAVEAIAAVGRHSLTSAFVLWGHRTYLELLTWSPNTALRDKLLPSLLTGDVAGVTGLSNAMKFLASIEELRVSAQSLPGAQGHGFVLNGSLAWATNLRPEGFHVAVAAEHEESGKVFIVSLAHDEPGIVRLPDLGLMALRGSNTAGLRVTSVEANEDVIIHPDANIWLSMVRPAFLALQCGMSIGLARRSLDEARACLGTERLGLSEEVEDLTSALSGQVDRLREGLETGIFRDHPAPLFRIRIALADIVMHAVALELQGSGGRAYLAESGAGFARRWREAAFIPIITPSLSQLKTALSPQC